MESTIKVADGICWVGVNDRTTDIFEGLWPLPRGISYNSYVICDEKVAVVDTVKACSFEQFLANVKRAIGEGRTVDYLIVNHMEPDHSGSIRMLKAAYPDLKIVGNKKTAEFLEKFFGIRDDVIVVADGDCVDLGRRKLKFYLTPMVHWPETMMTYEPDAKILFSGDAFGGFGALDGGIFDDEVDVSYIDDEILRYFSNIVGKYCVPVQKAIARFDGVPISIIAPTHGPVWRNNPSNIVRRYDRWSRHEAEDGVVIAYASMYGNTETMMEAVAKGISHANASVKIMVHDVSRTHVSYLIRDAWRFKAIILGSPAYDTKLFPTMDDFIRLLEQKQLRKRTAGIFGTYGWTGGGVSRLREFVSGMEWDLIQPVVEAQCSPGVEDLLMCSRLGSAVAESLDKS